MKNMGLPFPHEANKDDGDMPFLLHGSRKIRMRKLIIAASILIVLTAGLFLYLNNPTPVEQVQDDAVLATVTTKFGSRSNMQLPDGSKVWLNSGSTITYDKQFGKTIREVTLSGEAFFDVVKNPEKPFIIHTQSMDIKVLGTQFNVKSYANDKLSEASLIQGSLEVSLKRRSEKILLKPNEKIVVMNERMVKDTTLVIEKSNPSESIIAVQKLHYTRTDSSVVETSWVDNKLSFQDESFEDIAIRMERWYGTRIRFQDPEIKSWRFTGTFTNETIGQALEALQFTASFHYSTYDNTIVITNRKPKQIAP
jgi:ferric-dicitrate binding protein FerR (iron transport regulator)